MQTNILLFLLYSIIVALIVRVLPKEAQKYGLFVFNILFYLLCDAKFLFLILLGIWWSFFIGKQLGKRKEPKSSLLWLGILPVIILLGFFKYYHFFIPEGAGSLKIIMPLGISYYSFKIISYVSDIYKGVRLPEESWVVYANYVSFFPQIICGPISRSKDITEQIKNMKRPMEEMVLNGGMLILSGLFKKLVIADRLGTYVDSIFGNYTAYPSLALWMAAFFYTVQIYCDFAGYSEIAIGVSNLLGIECKKNFDLPYFSYSIKEFWRRWHISLSSWLRDYVYISLGGNRKGAVRQKINTLCTFIVSGIWHGNTLSFLFWGLYHGIWNLVPVKKADKMWKQMGQCLFTFVVVMFGWILFRAESLEQALNYILCMFRGFSLNMGTIIASVMPFTGDYSCLAYLLTVCAFILVLFIFEFREVTNLIKDKNKENHVKQIVHIVSIILFGVIGQNSFLYANF